MTNQEKELELAGTLIKLQQIKAENVEMSEAVNELTTEDKINFLYNAMQKSLEEDDTEVEQEKQEPEMKQEQEVAMSEQANEAVNAVAEATNEGKAEMQPTDLIDKVEEVKTESAEVKEVKPEVDYKALYEAEVKAKAEAEAKLEAAQKATPKLVHDPEKKVDNNKGVQFGTPGFKPTFTSPQDNVFAALAGR